MSTVLIICIGNPLRGDDALGWHAARRLERALKHVSAQIETCHQLTPDLAQPVSEARLVIFVDASVAAPAGEIITQTIEPSTGPGEPMLHRLDPEVLLAWSLRLFGRAPTAVTMAVGAHDFELGADLSPLVKAALPRLVRQIVQRVNDQARAWASAVDGATV